MIQMSERLTRGIEACQKRATKEEYMSPHAMRGYMYLNKRVFSSSSNARVLIREA